MLLTLVAQTGCPGYFIIPAIYFIIPAIYCIIPAIC